jgi:hypothetical protein
MPGEGRVGPDMPDDPVGTFEDFKNSFSYGSRNDLSFKFLKRLPPADAAEFFRLLLLEVGELFDGGSPEALIDLAYEWQVRAYEPRPDEKRPFTYDDRPFTQFTGSLADATVGLVTSSGHFDATDDPRPFGIEDMSQDQAMERIDDFLRSAPELTAISRDVEPSFLRVRHPGYDIRSVARDPGAAFPMQHLIEAEKDGTIGRLADEMYSFVGACAQGRIRREAPTWVDRWKAVGIDVLLLVPV